MTVRELIDKLQKIRNKSLNVYMLTDRSDNNYDEDGYPINCPVGWAFFIEDRYEEGAILIDDGVIRRRTI